MGDAGRRRIRRAAPPGWCPPRRWSESARRAGSSRCPDASPGGRRSGMRGNTASSSTSRTRRGARALKANTPYPHQYRQSVRDPHRALADGPRPRAESAAFPGLRPRRDSRGSDFRVPPLRCIVTVLQATSARAQRAPSGAVASEVGAVLPHRKGPRVSARTHRSATRRPTTGRTPGGATSGAPSCRPGSRERTDMAHRVTLIPGDGTGPEITEATRRVLEATGVAFEWDVAERRRRRHGDRKGRPFRSARSTRSASTKLGIKGPVTTPIGTGFRSVNVALRKALRALRLRAAVQGLPRSPYAIRRRRGRHRRRA